MPTSHAAVRHGVRWGKARRAEHAFLREWDAHRPRRRPRHLGADEIHRGKAQKFYTVLSDLVHGEVLGLAKDRTETSLAGLLTTCLDARQRAAVEAVCTDSIGPTSTPWRTSCRQRRSCSISSTSCSTPPPRWTTCGDRVLSRRCSYAGLWSRQALVAVATLEDRARVEAGELAQLFAANRRLFQAYVLREQLDRLWTYKTRDGVARFLFGWLKALRWQRLPEMERLGDTLVNHFDGIAAYCDHPVRFGVVESLNTTIKAVLRRARGMRDEPMLLLKLKWAAARPIRSGRDLARFLQPQELYSIGEEPKYGCRFTIFQSSASSFPGLSRIRFGTDSLPIS